MPVFRFSLSSRGYRFFFDCIASKVHRLALDLNVGSPATFVASDTLYSSNAVRADLGVPHIVGAAGFTKVAPAVIRFVTVDVVNFFRPAAFHDGENDAVGFGVSVINSDVPVAIAGADTARHGSSVPNVPNLELGAGFFSGLPDKFAGFGVVVEKFAESVNVRCSHCLASFKSVVRGLPVGAGSTPNYTTAPCVSHKGAL